MAVTKAELRSAALAGLPLSAGELATYRHNTVRLRHVWDTEADVLVRDRVMRVVQCYAQLAADLSKRTVSLVCKDGSLLGTYAPKGDKACPEKI